MSICTKAWAILGALLLSAGCEPNPKAVNANLNAAVQAKNPLELRRTLSATEVARAAEARLLPNTARSILPQGAMSHGDHVWDEAGIEPGQIRVWVDVSRQTVSVFEGGHEIGTAVILYGAPEYETPLGTFSILRKVADYRSKTYDAPMPYSLFLTNDGVALHASEVTTHRATHGCIGLPEEFAEKLFRRASKGDEVTIVRSVELLEAI